MRRREFLATLLGLVAVSGSVRAAGDPYATKPDHVSLEFDESTLEQYRPKLVTRHLEFTPTWLYGWVARSNEFDTDVACYWAWYQGQISDVKPASHEGDREPIYVAFDSETGEVEEVVVDGYHYFAARYDGAAIPFQEGDEYRPTFTVQKPYHFYKPGGEAGSDVDLKDMSEKYPDWWVNGWEVHQRAVVVPWLMTGAGGRSDWWPDDVGSFSIEAALRDAYLWLGWYGGDGADKGAIRT